MTQLGEQNGEHCFDPRPNFHFHYVALSLSLYSVLSLSLYVVLSLSLDVALSLSLYAARKHVN